MYVWHVSGSVGVKCGNFCCVPKKFVSIPWPGIFSFIKKKKKNYSYLMKENKGIKQCH